MSSSLGPFAYHVPFETKKRVKKWWKDSLISDIIFPPLEKDGELAKAKYFANEEDAPVPVTSVRDLVKASKSWRDQSVQIYAGKRETPSWLLHLRFTTEGPSIGLEVAHDPEGKIRERFSTWVAAWSRGLAEHDLHLSIGNMLAPDQMDYPRPRPPRQGTAWPLGTLDLYLGKRWHGEHDPGKQVFERIHKAKLTAGVRRVDVSDDVMRIAFDCDLGDAASVQGALARGESWLAPLVPTEITPGWNEHGDQMVVASTLVEREPFTFFDEDENIGYWNPVRDDGSVDEARWKKLAAIAKKGKLPDKTPVHAVRLVAPARKQALALLQRAAADGFEMVTYPGGEDVFWRVFP